MSILIAKAFRESYLYGNGIELRNSDKIGEIGIN